MIEFPLMDMEIERRKTCRETKVFGSHNERQLSRWVFLIYKTLYLLRLKLVGKRCLYREEKKAQLKVLNASYLGVLTSEHTSESLMSLSNSYRLSKFLACFSHENSWVLPVTNHSWINPVFHKFCNSLSILNPTQLY